MWLDLENSDHTVVLVEYPKHKTELGLSQSPTITIPTWLKPKPCSINHASKNWLVFHMENIAKNPVDISAANYIYIYIKHIFVYFFVSIPNVGIRIAQSTFQLFMHYILYICKCKCKTYV